MVKFSNILELNKQLHVFHEYNLFMNISNIINDGWLTLKSEMFV